MNNTNSRFEKKFANKFGDMFKSSFECPKNMGLSMETAIPIWIMLGLAETEYNLKYCHVPKVEVPEK